jgi:hypothetical protein
MGLAQKSGANVEGDISATYVYDVWNNPTSATSKLYKNIIAKYDKGANPLDANVLYGVASAWTMVQALRNAGSPPTRAGLMKALTNMNQVNPFLYTGVKMKTTPKERFPIDQQNLEIYKGTGWQPFGRLFSNAR